MTVDKTGGPVPCPFCGKQPETMPSGEGGRGLMIQCMTPNCVNPHTSYYDHASAIAVWNRRAPDPQAAARIEALERACRLALGPLTGGMDGEWSEDAPDPVDVLRDVLSGATPPADGLDFDTDWHVVKEAMHDAYGNGEGHAYEAVIKAAFEYHGLVVAHRGDKTQAIGAEVSP